MDTESLEYPLELSSAEMTFLLTTLSATSLPTGDNAALFPPDAAAQEALWAEGMRRMKERGLLMPGSEPGTWQMRADIWPLVAILPQPRLLLMTQIDTSDAPPGGIAHYLSPWGIVEMATFPEHYALSPIGSAEQVAQRLISLLPAAPALNRATVSFTLTLDQFAQVRAGEPVATVDPVLLAALRARPAALVVNSAAMQRDPVTGGTRIVLTSAEAEWWVEEREGALHFAPAQREMLPGKLEGWISAEFAAAEPTLSPEAAPA